MILGFASADYVRADMSHDGAEHWGGAGFARCGQYLPFLRAAGHEVVTGVLWQEDDVCVAIEDAEKVKHFPDVIIVQRLMMPGLQKAFKVARQAGQVIVNDIDDWYWGLSPDNEAFKNSHPKDNPRENTINYKQAVGASDRVTVSTAYLQKRIGEWYKGPIDILPNTVDVGRFTPVTITDTTVPEVGWVGSTLHRSGDIETLGGILPQMARAGRIKLVHAGHWDAAPTYASKLGCEEELIVRKTMRTGSEDYPSLLDFEVGVVPLRDAPFNLAKSAIKGLEYASAGIPFVAPRFGEYNHLYSIWDYDDGPGFYTAKKPQDWIRTVERLRDPDARQWAQDRIIDRVQAHDIAFGAARLLDYLESLVHV